MTSTAQVRVQLGDFIRAPTNLDIQSVEFQKNYKFKIGDKYLSWKPVGFITKEGARNQQKLTMLSA